jgi:hypothetical protein
MGLLELHVVDGDFGTSYKTAGSNQGQGQDLIPICCAQFRWYIYISEIIRLPGSSTGARSGRCCAGAVCCAGALLAVLRTALATRCAHAHNHVFHGTRFTYGPWLRTQLDLPCGPALGAWEAGAWKASLPLIRVPPPPPPGL